MLRNYKSLLPSYTIVTGLVILIISSVYSLNRSLAGSYEQPKLYAVVICVSLLLLFYLFARLLDKKSSFQEFTIIEFLLIVNVIPALVFSSSETISSQRIDLIYESLLIILCLVTRYISFNEMFSRQNLIKGFFIILAMIGLSQAIYGIIQYLLFDLLNPVSLPVKTVTNGTIGPSNGYGLLLGLCLFSTIFLLENKIYIVRKQWLILSGFIILFAFILSKSRGAWISFTISMILLYSILNKENLSHSLKFISNKLRINKWIILCLGLIFCLTLLSIVLFKLIMLNQQSAFGRLYAWQISYKMFLDNVFRGVGYGRFGPEFLNYQMQFLTCPSNQHLIAKASDLATPHNQYLFEFCEKGIIGGLSFIAICCLTIYNSITGFKAVQKNRKYIYLYPLLFITIIILHCIVDSSLVVVPIQIVFIIAIGFIPAPRLVLSKIHVPWEIMLCIFTTTFVIFSYFIFQNIVLDYRGRKIWNEANFYFGQYKYRQAARFYSESLACIPHNATLVSQYGISLIGVGEYERGINSIYSVINDYNEKSAWLALSLAQMRLQNLTAAENYAFMAHRMVPDQLRPRLMLAYLLLNRGDLKGAEVQLKKCVNQETSIHSPSTARISEISRRIYDYVFEESRNNKNSFDSTIFTTKFDATIDSVMLVIP